ncbi:hypothetical protein TWF102_006145 [Orbilia oligospora]|uniref:Uncharacterized protein n=1 Tax=Orbilia oligospora TaxID=2813651 RepID=A0A7C8NC06_ORBOL|nr:hypothetical protein TWF102_006145 [Orbilia oligospora]
MLFSTIIAFLPLLAPVFAKIDPVIDKDLTSPWAGKVGPVPRFECMCDCGSPEASRQVTTELCESAIKLGQEIGSSWGKEICTEKGCNATSTCDYISCSGIERTKWTAPEPEQGEETAEQDDA